LFVVKGNWRVCDTFFFIFILESGVGHYQGSHWREEEMAWIFGRRRIRRW
jgi:hypothetical protein